jgi:YidC/Oxa1 family membrane protein insertase
LAFSVRFYREDKSIQPVQSLKLLILPLIFISLLALFALVKQPATAAPSDNPARLIPSIAQSAGVTLEKKPSAEAVPLGHVVTYTVTIKNGGRETINPTLTDALPKPPEGLGLQSASITATVGTVQAESNTVKWSGSVGPGEEVKVSYSAIPPSIVQPGRTLTNVATLTFGSTTLEVSATITTQTSERGFWCGFMAPCFLVDFTKLTLVYLDGVLASIGLPYAFGFAIILFTLAVRVVTYPLNMQQIKSSKAMQELQPKMKELQEKHKNDREKLAQEQMRLYKEAGVNPLGGCLPMLVQMPIWIALYSSLIQLSHEGLLNEGFFWIPSLAGPATSACNGAGGFIPPWLSPFPFGEPCIGWAQALAYLVLPVLLVVSQFYMQQMMTPPNPDPQQASMNSMMKIMPVMFGYFSLIVPSGLTLYWFTSNILGLIQQYFTQGGLKPAAAVSTGKPVSASLPASPVTTTSEEIKQNTTDVKTKRKSRRKR